MDILNQISRKIDTLSSGEQWIITAQDLLVSRNDFQSLSIYLSRESEKGNFCVQAANDFASYLGHTSITVVKN